MYTKTQSEFFPKLLTALLAGLLLLSACAPAATATTMPEATATAAPMATTAPTETTAPSATVAPAATIAPTATAVSGSNATLTITLDMGSLATGSNTETVAAVSASANGPYWELLPEYTRVTLQGYPISSHLLKPQIFIYPLKDLGKVNEGAGKIAASLQTLLQSPQEITPMPFMPLFNASQVMHAHVQYLDFKNGKGLRFLTQFDQGIRCRSTTTS